ncbi:MAG: Spy/CpxP family protein refolding chaperone [Blastocatellia bacterium]|nr:Spy/CpxP family protein refolding chaperone [Blastocatellia bacterium]
MTLKNKVLAGFTLAAAVGSFAVSGSAQDTTVTGAAGVEKRQKAERGAKREGMHKRGGKAGFRGMRGGMGFRGLELTDAQKEQINTIREANRPDAAVREEMRSIMQARRAGTVTDEQKARAEVLRAQSRQHRETVRVQMEAILTAEQRAQLETRRQEMQQRMQERMQKMQERRQQRQQSTPSRS